MVTERQFSEEWPHIVSIPWENVSLSRISEAWDFLKAIAVKKGCHTSDIVASIGYRYFAFKDPRLAVEFKLTFA